MLYRSAVCTRLILSISRLVYVIVQAPLPRSGASPCWEGMGKPDFARLVGIVCTANFEVWKRASGTCFTGTKQAMRADEAPVGPILEFHNLKITIRES
jgi:hypothetical protein